MFKFNSEGPPGVMPKNIGRIMLAGAALVIVVASAFSGKKQKVVEQEKPVQIGPSKEQLDGIRKDLARERLEVEAANKRLADMKAKAASLPPSPPPQQHYAARSYSSPPSQPVGSARTVKVTNIALSIPELGPDRASQSALRVDETITDTGADGGADSEGPEETGPAQSGEFLPEREANGLYRIYEGTMIATALKNALEGSFTGPVECVVAESFLSSDGTVLIPEGARFLGEAHKVTEQNQTRLAVGFKRLLLPNGYSVKLNSAPGLDSAGTAGIRDKVNNHRSRTFGVAGAMGLINGLTNLGLGRGTNVIVNPMGSAASNSLSRLTNPVPTITIRAGRAVMVYLPADLLVPAYIPERNP